MQFHTVRELSSSPKSVMDSLKNGEIVITKNGKPSALMLDISMGDFEQTLRAIRQARFRMAIENMQERAVQVGLDRMTLAEINAEIAAARKDMADASRGD